MILKLPMRKQIYDFDCGVTVAWSKLRYSHIKIDYSTLLKMSKVCPVEGLSPQKLQRLLQKFGLNVEIRENQTIRDLQFYINKSNPAIVLTQMRKGYLTPWEDTDDSGHYQMVYGFKNKKIFLFDPSLRDPRILTYDEFNSRWHDGPFIKTVIV